MRITRPQMFMEIAGIVAQRSTCMRLNVGAVMVHQRSIVSIGYNGVPAGEEHCRGNDCPGKHGCKLTIHAEVNALARLPEGIDGPVDMYCTDSPCYDCWMQIVALHENVERVFFGTPYRVNDHLMTVGRNNLTLYRVTPAGHVMDWKTKELVDVET